MGFLNVDSRLYAHFRRVFLTRWENAGGYDAFGAELTALRALNEDLKHACNDSNAGLIRLEGATPCPCQMTLCGGDYTELLKQALKPFDAVMAHVAAGKSELDILHRVYFISSILVLVFMLWLHGSLCNLHSSFLIPEQLGHLSKLSELLGPSRTTSHHLTDTRFEMVFLLHPLIQVCRTAHTSDCTDFACGAAHTKHLLSGTIMIISCAMCMPPP